MRTERAVRLRAPEDRRVDVRARLRAATAAAHERMHAHPGFAAAAAGQIGLGDYRRLLARLYGFHAPFEQAAREAVTTNDFELDIDDRARCPALRADLTALGLTPEAIARLPQQAPRPTFGSETALLGALYVIEGSTLGGLQIARRLEGIAGEASSEEGRRFFLGRGDRQGAMWRVFVARLESLSTDPRGVDEAIGAAISTFSAFETWMSGWIGDADLAIRC